MTRELPVAAPDGLLVGTITGASGLKGEVKVKSFTAQPENIGRYGPLFAEDGRSFVVTSVRPQKGDLVSVRFKGIDDRSNAETLKGLRLYIPRHFSISVAVGVSVTVTFWLLKLLKHPPVLLRNVPPLAAGLCAGLGVHIARLWIK